ncbi:bromodomain-containing protein 2-like isoform X3 [Sycon ciliatum]|uniref:bromodomain-containing protein 2-like isoform X3 n=1 Tax=Sycon ciliatum TaxID=27933 RepID=UPI0031F6CBAF
MVAVVGLCKEAVGKKRCGGSRPTMAEPMDLALKSEDDGHDDDLVNGGGDDPSGHVSSAATGSLLGAAPVSSVASVTTSATTSASLTCGNGVGSRHQPEAVLDSPAVVAGKRNRKVSHKYMDDEPAQSSVSGGVARRSTNQLQYIQRTVLKALWKHQYAWPFLHPVDPVKHNLPDYFDIIKEPMELSTVKSRLETNYYTCAQQAADDLSLIFSNCKTYNKPYDDVTIMCGELEKVFLEKMEKMPPMEEVTQPGSEKRQAQSTTRSVKKEKDASPSKPAKAAAHPQEATKSAKRNIMTTPGPAPAAAVPAPAPVPVPSSVPMVTTTTGSKAQSKKTVKRQQADTTTPTAAPVAALSVQSPPSARIPVTLQTAPVAALPMQLPVSLPAPVPVTTAPAKVPAAATAAAASPGPGLQVVGERRGSARTVRKPKKDLPESPVRQRLSEPLKHCQKVIRDLCGKRHSRYSWPFLQPVDPVALGIPDYYDIITQPMDLGTVRDKMERYAYQSAAEFAADVRLVFDNCRRYNTPDHDVVHMAMQLQNAFEEQFAQLPDEHVPEESEEATAGEETASQSDSGSGASGTEEAESEGSESESDEEDRANRLKQLQRQLSIVHQQLHELSSVPIPTKRKHKKASSKPEKAPKASGAGAAKAPRKSAAKPKTPAKTAKGAKATKATKTPTAKKTTKKAAAAAAKSPPPPLSEDDDDVPEMSYDDKRRLSLDIRR